MVKGTVPLRIHVTDMSGLPATCPYQDLTADNVANTRPWPELDALRKRGAGAKA